MSERGSLKVWIFLSTLSIALMIAGLKLGDRHGLLAGFLAALAINGLVFFYGDLRLLKRFHGEQLEGQDPWGLLSRLEALAARAEIPTPRLFLVGLATPTTMSIGMSSGRAAILVSQGLVREFSPDEVEAVLAFEIARLKNHATVGSTAAAAITAGIAKIARALDQYLFLQAIFKPRPGTLGPAMRLTQPLIALLARVAIGRKQFLKSDQVAAQLIGNPERLARVLWKLHSYQTTRPFEVSPSDTPLFVVSPLTTSFWYKYLQLQPTLERRIRLLVGHYPL
ncbi:MAG: M48 family metalloprotease [Bdellovibrionaceae bacterium]|nr:M48 family metalloprotease [Pseudobdellovibrionaceae bacterium]